MSLVHKKGIEKRFRELKLNLYFPLFIEFSPEDLLDALSPVLDMLYDQFPDSLPFRQPVDPVVLQIPVSVLLHLSIQLHTLNHY